MRVIVSDTSPIRYLVLIGEASLLEQLYGRILIPLAVYAELQQPQTPDVVRAWAQAVPAWVEVIAESAPVTPIPSRPPSIPESGPPSRLLWT
jgi:predicted nucleic acid-binding protein